MASRFDEEIDMTVTGPKVKDFTGDPSGFPVEIVSAPVFELLMSLFTFSSIQNGSLSEFAVGQEWYDGIRSQASPELLDGLDRLEGTSEIWIELAATTLGLDEPTIEGLFSHLDAMDPVQLRLRLIVKGCMHCKGHTDRGLQERAAAGDESAIDELNTMSECRLSDEMRGLLTMDPVESKTLVTDSLRRFDAELFDADAIAPILDRDANHKRAMARTMPAPQLVETATNGITFQPQPEVDTIVLIPSIVIRPWVAIGGAQRARFFCYPVAEQHLTADPDSPPAHLVDVYKALGDEKRLRLMRILSEGPAALADITERVGLAKSTVHHHLSILRQAGLVLITLGTEKEYSLRTDAVPEAADLLAGFLITKE
jgi:DNA-binding transcriptional ArsR family regulator